MDCRYTFGKQLVYFILTVNRCHFPILAYFQICFGKMIYSHSFVDTCVQLENCIINEY